MTAANCERLFLVDGEGAGARRGDEEEDKAEADRFAAAIDQRERASGEMGEEIGDRHFARGDERGIAAEQAQHDQRAATTSITPAGPTGNDIRLKA